MEPLQPTAGSAAYYTHQLLSLEVEVTHSPLISPPEIQLRIKSLQQPWTLSCGMIGALDSGQQGKSLVFLKLFDRRWAQQLRSDNGIGPWSTDIEESYIKYVQSGRAASFLEKLDHEEGFKDTDDSWNDAENEAFLAHELLSLYDAEVSTYVALHDYQGKILPHLLAQVSLQLLPPGVAEPSEGKEIMQVKGLLLQYLPGFPLSALDQRASRSAWQHIVDQAVHITHTLGDNNVLNADVRPDNFMVVRRQDGQYRVFMIDLAQCRLRGEHESDAEWGRAKWQQDEEGAVGLVMRHRLRKLGFEYKFERSMRYLEWAPGEDDD